MSVPGLSSALRDQRTANINSISPYGLQLQQQLLAHYHRNSTAQPPTPEHDRLVLDLRTALQAQARRSSQTSPGDIAVPCWAPPVKRRDDRGLIMAHAQDIAAAVDFYMARPDLRKAIARRGLTYAREQSMAQHVGLGLLETWQRRSCDVQAADVVSRLVD